MLRLILTILALAPAVAAAQGLPPAVAAFAAEQSAVCTGLGGTPRVGPAFATAVDLNGDADLDYIVDLAGIECANAWSAFCGAEGCPVSVWIAGPTGHVREWGDTAQGWTIAGEGDAVAVVMIERRGAACDGGATCSERLAFEAPARAAPVVAADPGAEVAAPPAAAPAEALTAPGGTGWSLREVPGGTPVAVSAGPGGIATVAVFCLGGQPWLAASPREPYGGETAEVAFAFAASRVASPARREDGAGGALVIELAGRPVAGMLAGRDGSVLVSIDGVEQGVLSLRGSTRAIRGALESCAPS